MNRLDIGFVNNLFSGFQLCTVVDAETLIQPDRLIGRQCLHRIDHTRKYRKSAALCLFLPFLRITVSVEKNALMCRHIFLNQIVHRHVEIFFPGSFQSVSSFAERLCDNCVDRRRRASDRIRRADHTELELVSGKGKRRSTVSVRRIHRQIRHSGNAGM